MKPHFPVLSLPTLKTANPSLKSLTKSNVGLITNIPFKSINPHLSPFLTLALPSEKSYAPSNCGLITIAPVVLIKPKSVPT